MGIDVVTLALAKGYTDGKIRDAATDNDVIDALIENDLLCALVDEDGSILTDEFDNILV